MTCQRSLGRSGPNSRHSASRLQLESLNRHALRPDGMMGTYS